MTRTHPPQLPPALPQPCVCAGPLPDLGLPQPGVSTPPSPAPPPGSCPGATPAPLQCGNRGNTWQPSRRKRINKHGLEKRYINCWSLLYSGHCITVLYLRPLLGKYCAFACVTWVRIAGGACRLRAFASVSRRPIATNHYAWVMYLQRFSCTRVPCSPLPHARAPCPQAEHPRGARDAAAAPAQGAVAHHRGRLPLKACGAAAREQLARPGTYSAWRWSGAAAAAAACRGLCRLQRVVSGGL